MTLIDILTGPWAILPEQLLELQAIYATHLRGDKIDLAAIEARLGRPLANEQKKYEIADGTSVGILQVSGVIAPKANMFTRISGGAAASIVQQQAQSMAADPKVRSAIIDVDSPGGNVLGIPAAARAIRALADAKPTVVVGTGVLASGAYWLAAAGNAIFLSGETDMAGSIGVVANHEYDPKRSEGVQRTEVTAGKYKRIASENGPLTAEGKAYMQSQVDEIYRAFVNWVSDQRGVSVEDVLQHMADGRVFVGQQAIDAGLADGIATVDDIVEQLAANPSQFAARRKAQISVPANPLEAPAGVAGARAAPSAGPVLPQAPTPPTGASTMTPQERAAAFAAEHPEAAQALRAEGSTAERDRIQAVRAQLLRGHEALIEALAFDGKTTGPEAATQVLAAERAKLGQQASTRAADAPAPLKQAAAEAKPAGSAAGTTPSRAYPGYQVDGAAAKVDALARAYQAEHPGTDYLAAVKAVQLQLDTAEA